MSRGQVDRRLAPLSFGTGGADRWDLIDPELIVATASPRHQQSVLEDARETVRQLVGALRFALATLVCMPTHVEESGGKWFVRLGDDRASHGPMKTRDAAEFYARQFEPRPAAAAIAAARQAITWATGGAAFPVGLLDFMVWRPCISDKPDADVDVLLSWADGTPGAVGAWMGEHWIGPEGERLDPPPVLWTDVPEGPRMPV